ncbi:hypothetical protein DPMN_192703 [Dreissena polymorpha]|uniref:Uncharacterized protein n=1 Tax=Dreissena polymorpha TaxID=45954 RepID=A0A9D3Y7R5_DREPO|nr:hypothetical protein DPMN_192703 [Dreissena polymorpha]
MLLYQVIVCERSPSIMFSKRVCPSGNVNGISPYRLYRSRRACSGSIRVDSLFRSKVQLSVRDCEL